MKKILIITFLLLSALMKQTPAQWVQTKGPGAGVTTAMINVNDIILAGNLSWGRSDGSVYRTTDFGNDWIQADSGIGGGENNSIYTHAFANIGSVIFSANPSGVHRTFDYGNHWELANAGLLGVPLSLLAKDSLIFVGTDGPGVYVSTNLGITWSPRNNGLPQGTVIPYEFARLDPYIYVGLEGGGGPAPLYRSSNNGLFWEITNTGLPNGSNVHEFTVNGNTLFTSIIGDFHTQEYGMFRSTDLGSTWTAVNNGIPYVVGGNTLEVFTYNGNIYTATSLPAGERLYKSTNNGDSWFPTGNEIGNQAAWSFAAGGGYLFAGLGLYRSVFRSSNEGASWQAANRGLSNSNSRKLMEFGGRIYGGEFEGLFYTMDRGNSWTEMRNGLPFGLPITDLQNDGTNIFIGTEQYGIYRSTDNTATWTQNNSGITGTFAKYIEAIHIMNNEMYIGTWDGIFKSTNKGNNWTSASSGLPTEFGGSLVKINCINSLNGNLYAGTVLNKIFKSTNNGAVWFPSSSGINFYGSTVRDILVKDNTLFAATEAGVYKSTNEGGSWTLITPDVPTNKIIAIGENLIVSSYGPTVLTGYYIYLSTDDGATWKTFNEGMRDNARVQTLMLSGNTLFGGTDTRSVWTRDVSDLLAGKFLNLTLLMEGFYNPLNNTLTQDTVKIYLRNTTSPFAVVDSARAKLNSLGSVVLSFAGIMDSNPYYIQVQHRNSIETWSKSGGELFAGDTTYYDFTIAASQAFGSNLTLRGSRYCFYSGDIDQDGIIDAADLLMIYNNAATFSAGYVNADINGDNFVDVSDLILSYNNSNNFISVRRP